VVWAGSRHSLEKRESSYNTAKPSPPRASRLRSSPACGVHSSLRQPSSAQRRSVLNSAWVTTTGRESALANPWFRLYHEFADDPKVQIMSEVMQRRLVMLFCMRCKGETFQEQLVTFHWRVSKEELADTKKVFLASGFIDDKWNLLNWNARQFLSDSSTDRTRRYRERMKQDETSQSDPEEDGHNTPEREGNVTVTAPDTDTDTEQKQIQKQKQQARAAAKALAEETLRNAKALAEEAAKAKKPVAVAPLWSPPPWLDVEAWEAFDEMRKKLKKPMTPRARELIVKKLAGFEAQGHNSTEILNQSVVSGWTDVYAPKHPTGGNHGTRNNGSNRNTDGNAEALRQFVDAELERERAENNGDSSLAGPTGAASRAEDQSGRSEGVQGDPGRPDEGGDSASLFPRARRTEILSRPSYPPRVQRPTSFR